MQYLYYGRIGWIRKVYCPSGGLNNPFPSFTKVRWAGDRCCVCDSDVDYDYDQLVSCDGCGLTMHQSCYGIPELPDVDDM